MACGKIPEETIRNSKAKIIITPHIGEAKRLLVSGKKPCGALEQLLTDAGQKNLSAKQRLLPDNIKIKSEEERLIAVQILSKKFRCTALLKGHGTLIRGESGVIYKNTTGNPGMAAGGSGDVLSGMIAAFAGQGLQPEVAAACGAYIHGKAGDLAAEQLGQVSLSAADLPVFLAKAFLA